MLRVLSLLFLICCWLQLSVQRARVNTTEPPVPRPRIISGTAARPGQFPYVVSLRKGRTHFCGGAIVTPEFVVTAAHCVDGMWASSVSVHAGITRLNAYSDGEKVQVSRISVHPVFNERARGTFDVALLHLSRNLTFSSEINSIPMATSDPPANSRVTISGWGITNPLLGPVSNQLLYLNVSMLSREYCIKHHYLKLSRTTMCLYHNANAGACHGDSGGPAVYNGELVGIASWVLGSCGLAEPDGYERISALRSWILKEMVEPGHFIRA